jgi:hypothetical protein
MGATGDAREGNPMVPGPDVPGISEYVPQGTRPTVQIEDLLICRPSGVRRPFRFILRDNFSAGL